VTFLKFRWLLTENKRFFMTSKVFLLVTFAAAIPAIISAGLQSRAKVFLFCSLPPSLWPLVYPFFEGHCLETVTMAYKLAYKSVTGESFPRFAGSASCNAMGRMAGISCRCFYWVYVTDV